MGFVSIKNMSFILLCVGCLFLSSRVHSAPMAYDLEGARQEVDHVSHFMGALQVIDQKFLKGLDLPILIPESVADGFSEVGCPEYGCLKIQPKTFVADSLDSEQKSYQYSFSLLNPNKAVEVFCEGSRVPAIVVPGLSEKYFANSEGFAKPGGDSLVGSAGDSVQVTRGQCNQDSHTECEVIGTIYRYQQKNHLQETGVRYTCSMICQKESISHCQSEENIKRLMLEELKVAFVPSLKNSSRRSN